MASKAPPPFPIQMEVEFLDRLSEPVRDGKAKSVSDIIRTALDRYDFSDVVVMHPAQLLISVRLPVEMRRQLKKTARAKHTSVGHLVRAAVEAYLPELENVGSGQPEMAMPAPEPLSPESAARSEPDPRPRKRKLRKPATKKRPAKKRKR